MTNQIEALALLAKRKQTSHLLHLILSFLTLGWWVIVWFIVHLSNTIENRRIDRAVRKLSK